jgi:hypothetical protein
MDSGSLLTKRDLPWPEGRNNRVAGGLGWHGPRSGPALLWPGNGYRLPASGGRVAASEHFGVTGGRGPR